MEIKDKNKLTVAQQILHMESKGIQFNIEDKNFAENYLTNNTYYFKLKAYEKLYDKYPYGDNKGKYINLEFAYLRDLATIDSLIRKQVLSISLDIEHYLKVKLLTDFNLSPEDGYEIIKELFALNKEHYNNEIENKLHSRLCGDLIEKYKNNFAVWNFIEIIGFKDFSDLYALFYKRNCTQFCKNKKTANFKGEYYYFINPVRLLRNASAHNNCLLIGLNKNPNSNFNFEHKVSVFLSQKGIKNTTLNKQLSKPVIHDFCVMLYLYSKIAPEQAKKCTFGDLKYLFENKLTKNKDFYKNNYLLISAYEFMIKVINIFYNET